MNKNLQKLLNRAEELGWTVSNAFDNTYNFGKFSDAGQDFSINVDTEDDAYKFLHNLYERYSCFDVSEEASYWLDDFGHGKNGAPYDMRDVYEDMEQCQEMILNLYDELQAFYDTL